MTSWKYVPHVFLLVLLIDSSKEDCLDYFELTKNEDTKDNLNRIFPLVKPKHPKDLILCTLKKSEQENKFKWILNNCFDESSSFQEADRCSNTSFGNISYYNLMCMASTRLNNTADDTGCHLDDYETLFKMASSGQYFEFLQITNTKRPLSTPSMAPTARTTSSETTQSMLPTTEKTALTLSQTSNTILSEETPNLTSTSATTSLETTQSMLPITKKTTPTLLQKNNTTLSGETPNLTPTSATTSSETTQSMLPTTEKTTLTLSQTNNTILSEKTSRLTPTSATTSLETTQSMLPTTKNTTPTLSQKNNTTLSEETSRLTPTSATTSLETTQSRSPSTVIQEQTDGAPTGIWSILFVISMSLNLLLPFGVYLYMRRTTRAKDNDIMLLLNDLSSTNCTRANGNHENYCCHCSTAVGAGYNNNKAGEPNTTQIKEGIL